MCVQDTVDAAIAMFMLSKDVQLQRYIYIQRDTSGIWSFFYQYKNDKTQALYRVKIYAIAQTVRQIVSPAVRMRSYGHTGSGRGM